MKLTLLTGLIAAILGGLTAGSRAAPTYSLFNPGDYAVLTNDFSVTGGATVIAIDTKDGTASPTWMYGSTNFTGLIVTNQSAKVVMALFTFGNLAISNGVSCTVTGNLGLVLACTGNMTLGNTIDLSGKSSTISGGPGGPGGEAGVRATCFTSAPPTAVHGQGGGLNQNGTGYGGGQSGPNNFSAGGGGYGGVGGYGASGGPPAETAPGGTNYGDSALANLCGGSGGAGAGSGYGGGGGGALELIANGTLTITATATQRVNGGDGYSNGRGGGGGSGGGLILAANIP